MICVNIRSKWNGNNNEIIKKINGIDYFKSIREDIDKVLELIEDPLIRNKVLKNGSFCDRDGKCKTTILFLAGSGKEMEMRIQCFGDKSDKLKHLLSEQQKILDYIDQKNISFLRIFKRKIKSKTRREELKIENFELYKENISQIFGIKNYFPIYLSSIALFFTFLYQTLTNNPNAFIQFVIFLSSIPLNFLIMFIINYFGGKKFAYHI